MAENLATHRKRLGLDQRELARRVTDEFGRPMTASIISKIEKGDRRVDVDDLVALAAALGVSPVTLMLPDRDSGEPVLITSERSVPWEQAWRWATGESPLPGSDLSAQAFLGANRPYEESVSREAKRFVALRVPERPYRLTVRGFTDRPDSVDLRIGDIPVRLDEGEEPPWPR
ncbi:helix-turn-helix transcriptional regulator [Streptomyces cupreus]|uniref:helix-turn-helix domain-containing protein n=1 Tax=Streptomyces cupreus TaxID=2759956 RepID=UPI00300C5218